MLTTNNKSGLEMSDGTLYVLPGTFRLGNRLMPFDGTRITYSQMSTFTVSDSSSYQNSLLYLYDTSGVSVDMTKAVSSIVTDRTGLTIPYITSDYTYATEHPLGLFTLYTTDGSTVSIFSSYIP
jgi:hypothetical protein